MIGAVYNNGTLAGYLEKTQEGIFVFTYDDDYYRQPQNPAISLTLPKTQKIYRSTTLFAFFYGMLAEGINKDIQCHLFKIDEDDDFSRLLRTAGDDTIGAITVKPISA